ncbi:hypothetical protein NDU88_000294 [Pleurodeles waltl]|uniref:Uncharacterized protein n=1 Tax=Pleurodeles waltl TaxID=8319 RepID=A0AAV7L9I1_PLEWA|nr:hypothetical protein NDU88_000294 [Pleurodeles waltl]
MRLGGTLGAAESHLRIGGRGVRSSYERSQDVSSRFKPEVERRVGCEVCDDEEELVNLPGVKNDEQDI